MLVSLVTKKVHNTGFVIFFSNSLPELFQDLFFDSCRFSILEIHTPLILFFKHNFFAFCENSLYPRK